MLGYLDHDDAHIFDVRTAAEWQFVGTPDLEGKNAKYIQSELFEYPGMAFNNNFITDFDNQFSGNKESLIFCLCRSGARSQKAAEILRDLGYKNLFNITDGFEGDLNNKSQRSSASGWKFSGLPWKQS